MKPFNSQFHHFKMLHTNSYIVRSTVNTKYYIFSKHCTDDKYYVCDTDEFHGFKTIEELESGINDLEMEKMELDKVLSDHSTYQDSDMITGLQKKYSEVIQKLESLYKEWEITQNKIDRLMSGIKNT